MICGTDSSDLRNRYVWLIEDVQFCQYVVRGWVRHGTSRKCVRCTVVATFEPLSSKVVPHDSCS